MPGLFLSFLNEQLTCDLSEEPSSGGVISSRASSLRRPAAASALPHMRENTPLQAQGSQCGDCSGNSAAGEEQVVQPCTCSSMPADLRTGIAFLSTLKVPQAVTHPSGSFASPDGAMALATDDAASLIYMQCEASEQKPGN